MIGKSSKNWKINNGDSERGKNGLQKSFIQETLDVRSDSNIVISLNDVWC